MPNDEASLVADAIAGDAVALQLLLVNYHAALLEEIGRRLPAQLAGVVAPEDICQETYIAAARGVSEFRPAGDGAFFAWLRTIAERKLTDAIRACRAAKRGKGRQITAPTAGAATSMVALLDRLAVDERTPSQSVARREIVQHVQAALEKLDPDYREVLRLRYGGGLSVAEVARRMERGEGAVKMLCSRALKQLSEEMGDLSRFLTRTQDLPPDSSEGRRRGK